MKKFKVIQHLQKSKYVSVVIEAKSPEDAIILSEAIDTKWEESDTLDNWEILSETAIPVGE